MAGTVRYDVDGAVATLTLDRPQRLNAIVPELVDDFEAALDRAERDVAIRAVRLRGSGRSFCAGYDIEWGAEAMPEPWDAMAGRTAVPAPDAEAARQQAYEQMALPVTQLIGTLLDGAARASPEGAAFTRAARHDVRRAVAERDAPFGDGQEPR